jgi:AhpD family alkylhydroperoxidase
MEGPYHELLAELRAPTSALRRAIPDAWAGFLSMHQGALADGEVSGALKEVIALAIAAVKQCDGCIAYHARAAVKAGATAEQVAEVLGVALLMDGGTATVYGPKAYQAFLEFAADREPAAG